MQNVSRARTAWVRKVVLVLLVILSIAVCLGLWVSRRETHSPNVQTNSQHTTNVTVNGQDFTAYLAATPEEQRQGLSGRTGLDTDQAMLFTFDTPGEQCFWMKDMLFSIDMVWLGSDKKINTIESNVSPSTYPDQNFCPDQPAQYVLEFAAGTAETNKWQTGTQFSF